MQLTKSRRPRREWREDLSAGAILGAAIGALWLVVAVVAVIVGWIAGARDVGVSQLFSTLGLVFVSFLVSGVLFGLVAPLALRLWTTLLLGPLICFPIYLAAGSALRGFVITIDLLRDSLLISLMAGVLGAVMFRWLWER
jgi:hypothetical protein